MVSVTLAALAVAVAAAMLISILLFSVEVLVKQRDIRGQVLGLILSILGAAAFGIVFSDRLPVIPEGWRSIFNLLPSVNEIDLDFKSSTFALVALVVVYTLRIAIYTRLFIIPALTLSDEEYRSQEQVEQRANDYTAPVLAFATLAICVSSAIAGIYALHAYVGTAICVALVCGYFISGYLRSITDLIKRCAIWARIAYRYARMWASRLIVLVIVAIGRAELWRRRQVDRTDFDPAIVRRLRTTIDKANAQNTKDFQLLRDLAFGRSR